MAQLRLSACGQKQQSYYAQANSGVSDVESRPMICPVVRVYEVNYLPEPQAIYDVAEGSAGDQRQRNGGAQGLPQAGHSEEGHQRAHEQARAPSGQRGRLRQRAACERGRLSQRHSSSCEATWGQKPQRSVLLVFPQLRSHGSRGPRRALAPCSKQGARNQRDPLSPSHARGRPNARLQIHGTRRRHAADRTGCVLADHWPPARQAQPPQGATAVSTP